MSVTESLIAQACAAFGWQDIVDVWAGPRGALGQIFRIELPDARYALKEIFDEPPTEWSIGVELDFTRNVGVRVPASIPDRDGRHLLTTAHGTWLRCYEWMDLHHVAVDAADTPRRIGAMLADLHHAAPVCSVEPNGGEPADRWYDSVPSAHEWADALASDAPWSRRLREVLRTYPQLCAAVAPAATETLRLCHRDLHPENVFVDDAGELVVVDWDDLGPADPGRELARMLFDWFCDAGHVDLGAAHATVEAYRDAGGPGRVTELADFSMLLAGRMNFLLSQLRIAADPHAEPRHRDWAAQEVAMVLRIMPTADQLSDVLAVARRCFGDAAN